MGSLDHLMSEIKDQANAQMRAMPRLSGVLCVRGTLGLRRGRGPRTFRERSAARLGEIIAVDTDA
jgi:hypothetical protein